MLLPAFFRYAPWIRGSTSRHVPSHVSPGAISRGRTGAWLRPDTSALDEHTAVLDRDRVGADAVALRVGRRAAGVHVELELVERAAQDHPALREAVLAQVVALDHRLQPAAGQRAALVRAPVAEGAEAAVGPADQDHVDRADADPADLAGRDLVHAGDVDPHMVGSNSVEVRRPGWRR